jgi:hypothetical protein
MLATEPRQLGFGLLAGFDINDVGQPMAKAPNHRHVASPDASGTLRGGGGRQPRRQRFAG